MRIFFSAGEPSGDRHAAHLIESLRARRPDIEFSGFGGPLMEEAGCRTVYPLTNLAVMGFAAVIPLLWKFYQLVKLAERSFQQDRPDLVILVDFPGFNWWIARKAKAAGIPVYYYMPPQLWAWASWRIGRVRKYIDCVLCALPFEAAWYKQRGANVEYVGHPFFDEVANQKLDEQLMAQWRSQGKHLVAVLPGSRNEEVRRNWPIMLEVMRKTTAKHKNCRFVVANYKEEHRQACEEALRECDPKIPATCYIGKTSEAIDAADCAIMVSGSVSLEMLARKTPAAVVYRMGLLFYFLARLLVRCKFASLPNLIADSPLFPEFLFVRSNEQTVRPIADLLDNWLSDSRQLAAVRNDVEALRKEVYQTGAGGMAADAILRRFSAISSNRRVA